MSEYEAVAERNLSLFEWDIAVHEAGHIMLADALGVEIMCVSIEGVRKTDRERLGFTQLIPECDRNSLLVVAQAGRAADLHLNSGAEQRASSLQYCTDEERAAEYLSSDCSPKCRELFHQRAPILLTGWTSKWVKAHEVEIISFAKQLKIAKRLSGPTLRYALDESWDGQKPEAEALRAEVREAVEQVLDTAVATVAVATPEPQA